MPNPNQEAVEAIVKRRVAAEHGEGRAVNDHREHMHRENARLDLKAALTIERPIIEKEVRERLDKTMRPILRSLNGINPEALLSLGLRQRQITAALAALDKEGS